MNTTQATPPAPAHGLFTALAITIHKRTGGSRDVLLGTPRTPAIGLAIAVAVAPTTPPEGVSVSVPIYYATGNRTKAFVYSLLSGFAEFVGAVIAFMILYLLLGGGDVAVPWHVVGILLGGVAGIMVYISLDELLPTSRAYAKATTAFSASCRHGRDGSQPSPQAVRRTKHHCGEPTVWPGPLLSRPTTSGRWTQAPLLKSLEPVPDTQPDRAHARAD
jgi:hypothetical protein